MVTGFHFALLGMQTLVGMSAQPLADKAGHTWVFLIGFFFP